MAEGVIVYDGLGGIVRLNAAALVQIPDVALDQRDESREQQQPGAPVLVAPANAATGVSTSPALQVTASDPDGEPLTLSVDLGVLPPDHGASFALDPGGAGTFSWTPAYDQAGTYSVTFQLAGYKPATKSVTIEKGKTTEVDATLEKQ